MLMNENNKLTDTELEEVNGGIVCLNHAPELPATRLAEECYQQMFEGCSSLTKAPDLPPAQLTAKK